jgi:hypothetical protein
LFGTTVWITMETVGGGQFPELVVRTGLLTNAVIRTDKGNGGRGIGGPTRVIKDSTFELGTS